MKILRAGRKKRNKMHGKCRECGCRVEVDPHETKRVEDPREDPFFYVKCPNCKFEYLVVAPYA